MDVLFPFDHSNNRMQYMDGLFPTIPSYSELEYPASFLTFRCDIRSILFLFAAEYCPRPEPVRCAATEDRV